MTPFPHPSVYASSLSPDQRSYVNASIAHAVNEIVAPLIAETQNANANNAALLDEIKTLRAKVASYEAKLIDDTKYILTRGKIVALMKELDIK